MSDSKSTPTPETTTPAAPVRRFMFNGTELMDLDPTAPPETIRDMWSGTYPALQNAKMKSDVRREGEVEVKVYTFTQSVGTLG